MSIMGKQRGEKNPFSKSDRAVCAPATKYPGGEDRLIEYLHQPLYAAVGIRVVYGCLNSIS